MQPSSAVVQMPSAQLQLSSTARFSATEFAARASSVCSAQPSPTGCSPSQRQLNCCQLRPSSTLWRGSFQPSSQREPTYFAQPGLVQPGATQLRCCSPPASSAPAQQPRSTQLNGSSTEVGSTLRLSSVVPSFHTSGSDVASSNRILDKRQAVQESVPRTDPLIALQRLTCHL